MGNCIGRKSYQQNKHKKYHSVQQQNTKKLLLPNSQLNNNEKSNIENSLTLTIVNEQIKLSNILPSENKRHSIIDENSPIGYLFNKTNNNEHDIENTNQSFHTSPSPSLSDSSLSSFSCNTTSFSSQDQIILSSSSSLSSNNINHIQPHTLPYKEQIDFQSNQILDESFSVRLPILSSCQKSRLFENEFQENIQIHYCNTLSSIVDNVVQQQFIRIHQRTKTTLIEHKKFKCVHLKDLNRTDSPLLIYDETKNCVYITKSFHTNELESLTYHIKEGSSNIFSSCNHCSTLLSGSKLMNYLYPFIITNATYNLVDQCFNPINLNHSFGYISQLDSNHIQQIIVNNSKLISSYDLDVDYRSFYFVLYVETWPDYIILSYNQRKRLWPIDNEKLFSNTCFIQYHNDQHENLTNEKCLFCNKILSSTLNSSWCYTYEMIEAKLILIMSDGQKRFASVLWNYLNEKCLGTLPFNIYKNTLFYFFEQYSSDSFTTSDLISHMNNFIEFFLNSFQKKSFPNYFYSNKNLYNEQLAINLTNLLSIKMANISLRKFSILTLPRTSLYLYHMIYLIEFQSNFIKYYYSSKTNLIQTIFDTQEIVLKKLSSGIQLYQKQFDSTTGIKSYRKLTLDALYKYQEDNVQMILDYLPMLREREPSLVIHSLWSLFIQYFNSLFTDLFIS